MKNSDNRHRRHVNENFRYNNSSSAYDYKVRRPITYDDIEQKRIEKRKREVEKQRLAKLRKAEQAKKKEAAKKDRLNHILCYVLAFYLIGVGVFVLKQFDNNNLIRSQISEKQTLLNEQEKQISDLKIALADSIDIHEIERVAKNELGMKTPSVDQLVYITLPENTNYIEYEQEKKTSDVGRAKIEDKITSESEINETDDVMENTDADNLATDKTTSDTEKNTNDNSTSDKIETEDGTNTSDVEQNLENNDVTN